MPIVFTKKKKPAPAPVVPVVSNHVSLVPEGKKPEECTFCNHVYMLPCHGQSDSCMNAKWKREREAAEAKTKKVAKK